MIIIMFVYNIVKFVRCMLLQIIGDSYKKCDNEYDICFLRFFLVRVGFFSLG